jgi:hypothetical protein
MTPDMKPTANDNIDTLATATIMAVEPIRS